MSEIVEDHIGYEIMQMNYIVYFQEIKNLMIIYIKSKMQSEFSAETQSTRDALQYASFQYWNYTYSLVSAY